MAKGHRCGKREVTLLWEDAAGSPWHKAPALQSLVPWCALLPWSPLRRQHQASSSSPPRGTALQSQGRPPAASPNHPAEA